MSALRPESPLPEAAHLTINIHNTNVELAFIDLCEGYYISPW